MGMERGPDIALKQPGYGMAQAAAGAPGKARQPQRAKRKMGLAGIGKGQRQHGAYPKQQLQVPFKKGDQLIWLLICSSALMKL